jgi:type IV secretion system protein VirD4
MNYKKLTGRNYEKDAHRFHKSYHELIEFYTHCEPKKIKIGDLPIEDWHNADGVILGKIKDANNKYHLIKRDSYSDGNLACFGLPGSGKTTAQAAPTAIRFNNGDGGVFAILIKGDFLEFLKGKRNNINVITPDKAEGSCHFNPLGDFVNMSWTDRRTFVEMLSTIICPEESGENSAYFVGGARDYFCGVTLYMMQLFENGELDQLTLHTIIDYILQNDVFTITETIQRSDYIIAGEYTNSYIGNSEKNVSGIFNHLAKRLRPFNNGALRTIFDGKGKCLTTKDLESGDIYIDIPQDKFDVYAPAMAVIVSEFLLEFMQRPDVATGQKVKPIMFLLDEAVQLHIDFSILSKAMSTLRSKKVSIFLLMQSIAQLEGCYGEAHTREIIDLCAYISVINAQDPKSRRFFQELCGKKLELQRNISGTKKTQNNSSNGYSISEVEKYAFNAEDFGDLRLYDKKANKYIPRILVYANGHYALAETTPYYE